MCLEVLKDIENQLLASYVEDEDGMGYSQAIVEVDADIEQAIDMLIDEGYQVRVDIIDTLKIIMVSDRDDLCQAHMAQEMLT